MARLGHAKVGRPERSAVIGIVGYVVAGSVVGGLARVLRPGAHDLALPVTLGLGAAGAVAGGVLAGVVEGLTLSEAE